MPKPKKKMNTCNTMHPLYKTLLLGAALLGAACQPAALTSDGSFCTVSFSAIAPPTKADAGTTAERTVHRLDLFAFDASGRLENSYHDTRVNDSGFLNASVTVSSGIKDFYLVANAPADLAASVTTLTQLQEAVSLFAQTAPDRFVMTACLLRQVIERDTPLSAQLVRIASRFEIRSVTKAFASPALQALPLQIEALFLMNAPMQAGYFPDQEQVPDPSASSGWGLWSRNDGSSSGAHPPSGNVLATTRYTPASPISVTGTDTSLAGHCLYAYPNVSAEAPEAGTLDYVTKLVLQVRLGNDTVYYTLGIPQTRRNSSYSVENLTLRRRGTDIPGPYVSTDDVTFRVTVKDWDSGSIESAYADGSGNHYAI